MCQLLVEFPLLLFRNPAAGPEPPTPPPEPTKELPAASEGCNPISNEYGLLFLLAKVVMRLATEVGV